MGTSSSKEKTGNARISHATSSRWRSNFQAIADQYTTLDQVVTALRSNGLESSNLIVAVDYTKSNEWTGKFSFGGRCLHVVGQEPNPYENAISIIARTLKAFDDDGLIPVYGFGDATTQDSAVFSFFPNEAPARGLDELVGRYRELTPYARLAGPTSFAPAIYQAMKVVVQSGCQYHILVIVADGQVTRPSDMSKKALSRQEQATVDAIVAASQLPLSIILVGVGDGPWDVMQEFDDKLPARRWDNFQFVNFTEVASRYRGNIQQLEAAFAVKALMEIPDQFKLIQRFGLLGNSVEMQSNIRCLPPPIPANAISAPPQPPMFGQMPAPGMPVPPGAGPPWAPPPAGYPPPGGYPTPGGYPPPGGPPGLPTYASGPAGMPYPGGPPQALYAAPSFGAALQGYPSGPAAGMPAPGPHYRAADPAVAPTPGPGAGGVGDAGAGVGADSERVDTLFVCPITQELMTDPVVAADGYTYDRASISKWLETHDTSPMTNAPLANKNLTANHALRSSIMEHLDRSRRR